uniref:Evasin n=1 Tax=Rhipicephalus sanguineus TaxID=34632 RepID=C9W1D9_RHISA
MAFKACITVLAAVYVVQNLCVAHVDLDLDSGSSSSSEEDYEGSCLYPILHIANNKSLALNCTSSCGDNLNDTMPCVNATNPTLNYNTTNYYNCTVGLCNNGTCHSNNTVQLCWLE